MNEKVSGRGGVVSMTGLVVITTLDWAGCRYGFVSDKLGICSETCLICTVWNLSDKRHVQHIQAGFCGKDGIYGDRNLHGGGGSSEKAGLEEA